MKNEKEYLRKRRSNFKRQGLCPKCGKEREDPKFVYCAHCRKVKRRYERDKKVSRDSIRLKRAEWIQLGLCSRDGREIEDKNYKQCERCRKSSRDFHRLHNIGTVKNGKPITIKHLNKQPYPTTGKCQLCGKDRNKKGEKLRLHWHHWDDNDPERGVWCCAPCHTYAGMIDKHEDKRIKANYFLWKRKMGTDVDGEPCIECKAASGEFHKLGCDWEMCSLCGDQLIICDCPDEAVQEKGRIPYIDNYL